MCTVAAPLTHSGYALVRYPKGGNGASELAVSENSFRRVSLNFPFVFFGKTYNQVYVSDNGYVTFAWGDTSRGRGGVFANHWSQPRIAALFGNLSPAQGGVIRVRQEDDFAVSAFLVLDLAIHSKRCSHPL